MFIQTVQQVVKLDFFVYYNCTIWWQRTVLFYVRIFVVRRFIHVARILILNVNTNNLQYFLLNRYLSTTKRCLTGEIKTSHLLNGGLSPDFPLRILRSESFVLCSDDVDANPVGQIVDCLLKFQTLSYK